MIHSIKINEFRGLKNIKIRLGEHITAISGRNGLGKSTILALLGNSCELKVKDGKTLFNTQFKTEFGEIFKASKEFDKSGSNKCSINFSTIKNPNEISDIKICRVTWQKERFRIIPETKNKEVGNSRKKEWPSLYLGLSRLYPVGEANESGMKINSINLKEDEKKDFLENYKTILNLYDNDEICVDMIAMDETKRKKGVGLKTKKYDSITNSAGQDNLGQILLAVLSFKRLSESNSNYEGGLLLIDEIDATLHPVAQIKLLNFLISACRKYKLQVVFTTHSMSLLKELSVKTLNNKDDVVNKCEVCYLTKCNGPLKNYRNPTFSIIENDLMLSQTGANLKPVTIYSEDAEGRWFLENLISEYALFVKIIKIKLGCGELLNLNKNDPAYFSNVIFVVDGDVQQKDIDKLEYNKNIIKLPGLVRPEEVFYKFLLGLDSECELWSRGFSIGFSKDSIKENGPFSKKYCGKDRDRFKQWFNDIKPYFESLKVFDYWVKYNEDDYNKFLNEFIECYNVIAERTFTPKISK